MKAESNLVVLLLFFLTAMNVALYVTAPERAPKQGCGVGELQEQTRKYLDWLDANLGRKPADTSNRQSK